MTLKTSILRESFNKNLSVISSQHPANHSSCSPGLLFVRGTLANIPAPHLLARWFEHSPAPLHTKPALWGCDFCPASCLEVPREAKKYRAEFLGTYFAFGLAQGSELCIGCRRKKSGTDFSVPCRAGQVWVWGQSLVCSWIPPCPQAWITQLLSNCSGFSGWSLLRTDSLDGADSHSPGTNSAPINAQRLWQAKSTWGLTPVQRWLILNLSHLNTIMLSFQMWLFSVQTCTELKILPFFFNSAPAAWRR